MACAMQIQKFQNRNIEISAAGGKCADHPSMQPERIRGWHDKLIVGYIGISQLEKGFEDFIGDVFTLSLNEFNVSIFCGFTYPRL